ncbi:hypothetical protein DPMN_050799 [Dreissena polymorpha]|uniref:Uncharacterized protein n=1 Tax=Dreissena polymorpha TaxID=45954 RepID=A0A9D4CI93_DREPO|nr:hypothetical protein DPMN_050799 [Dreissena polymorpha]
MRFHAAKINACFLQGVSSTSSGDTASRRILNTTNIIDPSNQLSCTACMLRNKAKPVQCQLPLPTKHELYVSGRGAIDTNCTGNCTTARSDATSFQAGTMTQINSAVLHACSGTRLNLFSANFHCQQSTSSTCQDAELSIQTARGIARRQGLEIRFHAAKSNAGFLKGVSSTSFGDTASRRILNTTNIIDPSNQLSCTACMLRNKAKPVQCQLPLPTKHELYVSGRGAIDTNCTGNCTTARLRNEVPSKSNAGFLKGVSSTSSGDTASRRILNTTNIIDPSNQLSCTACMLRNKAKPVQCQLPLPTKHELYVSGRGAIDTNCTGNCTTARLRNEVPSKSNAGFLKGVSSTSSGDTASRRILNTTNIIDPSNQLSCTACMLRNKAKPVQCQLPLPTKHELYVSGRGAIDTNCTGN